MHGLPRDSLSSQVMAAVSVKMQVSASILRPYGKKLSGMAWFSLLPTCKTITENGNSVLMTAGTSVGQYRVTIHSSC